MDGVDHRLEKRFALRVQAPPVLPLGAADTVQVTATSSGDPSQSAVVEITTRLRQYPLYMPEIER